MTIALINGIDLYYEEHGDAAAEPVLLIMGLSMNCAAWAMQIPALSQRYRVVAFDNRGCGRSSQPHGAYSIAGMAADAAALLDHVGIDRTHIVGASMGGMIAQEFALRFPARVRSLSLLCTTPGGPHTADYERMLSETARVLAANTLEEIMTPEQAAQGLAELFTPAFLKQPTAGLIALGAAAMQHPQTLAGLQGQLSAVRGHDTWARLPQIHAPTQVLYGDEDPLVLPSNSALLGERIPGAEVHPFTGQRHGFFVERPEETNALLLRFLARHAMTPART
ncbi:MAG: alpha/beta fold hydrolase [Chloroflexi bacterium]|nr:alpha/beta fold hydrolase [Chloroflexota bacterium]